MKKTHAKQIQRILSAPIVIQNLAISGTPANNNVSSAIATALATASNSGGSVPTQVSPNVDTKGVITGANYLVNLYKNGSKEKIVVNGEEVYGRLTESAGVWTLTYYTLQGSTETATNLPSGLTAIDFIIAYRFDFHEYPADANTRVQAYEISQEPNGVTEKIRHEALAVTGVNTVASTTRTVTDTSRVILFVNGQAHLSSHASPSFSITSGGVVTWNSANAGFSLDTGDEVIAEYPTLA